MWDAGHTKKIIAINTIGTVLFNQLSSELNVITTEKLTKPLTLQNTFVLERLEKTWLWWCTWPACSYLTGFSVAGIKITFFSSLETWNHFQLRLKYLLMKVKGDHFVIEKEWQLTIEQMKHDKMSLKEKLINIGQEHDKFPENVIFQLSNILLEIASVF